MTQPGTRPSPRAPSARRRRAAIPRAVATLGAVAALAIGTAGTAGAWTGSTGDDDPMSAADAPMSSDAPEAAEEAPTRAGTDSTPATGSPGRSGSPERAGSPDHATAAAAIPEATTPVETACHFAQEGTGWHAPELCWIDLFDPAHPGLKKDWEGTVLGTPLSRGRRHVDIDGGEHRLVFDLSYRNVTGWQNWEPEPPQGLATQPLYAKSLPVWDVAEEDKGAFMGRKGQYVGISGSPAVHHPHWETEYEITLSDIRLERNDGTGTYTPITDAYALVLADAESTDGGEYLQVESNGDLIRALPNTSKAPPTTSPDPEFGQQEDLQVLWGNSCAAWREVSQWKPFMKCVGQHGKDHSDASPMVKMRAPATRPAGGWNVSVRTTANAKQAVAFAVQFRGVTLQSSFPETPGTIDGDRLRTLVLREFTANDGTTKTMLVRDGDRDAAGHPDGRVSHRDFRVSETATFYVGHQVRGGTDPPSAAATDYAREWGAILDGATAQPPGGATVPGLRCLDGPRRQWVQVEEVHPRDLPPLDSGDRTWGDDDTVFAKVVVPANSFITCGVVNTPHTVQVTNRVEGGPATADDWSFAASTAGGSRDLPLARESAAEMSSIPLPVRPGTLELTAAGRDGETSRYLHAHWARGEMPTHQVPVPEDQGPAGTVRPPVSVDLPAFPVRGRVIPTALHAASVMRYFSGELAWTKTSAGSLAPLAGSRWELVGDERAGVSVAVADCVGDDSEACADMPDRDPEAGKFLVTDLPPGGYLLCETASPPGHWPLEDGCIDFRASLDGAVTRLEQTVENVPINPNAVRKVEGAPGDPAASPLPGAAFAIRIDEDGQPGRYVRQSGERWVLTTGQDGTAVGWPTDTGDATGYPVLELNRRYWLEEIASAAGHELLPGAVPFQLKLAEGSDGVKRAVIALMYAEGSHPLVDLLDPSSAGIEDPGVATVVGVANVPTQLRLPVVGGGGPWPLIWGAIAVIVVAGTANHVLSRRDDAEVVP